MSDLITPNELIDAWPGAASLPATEQYRLCSAASRRFEKLTDRIFGASTWCEIHRPGRTRKIYTRQKPINNVERVATDVGTVLIVQCVDQNATRALVAFTGTAPNYTGLVATSYHGPAATVTPFTYVEYPTIGSIEAAFNALPGWTASVASSEFGDYTAWQSSDLSGDVGQMEAILLGMEIKAYTRDLAYACDTEMARKGTIELFEGRPDGYRYPDRRYGAAGMGYTGMSGIVGDLDPRVGAVYVRYQFGTPTAAVDPDIKRACTILAKYLREAGTYVTMASETDGRYSYSRRSNKYGLPDEVRDIVEDWRRKEIF